MTGAGSGVADADLLLPFADAALAFDETAIAPRRAAIVARLGTAAMIDAAAVIAGFNGITRIADATGIPLEPAKEAESATWRDNLGISAFRAAKQ